MGQKDAKHTAVRGFLYYFNSNTIVGFTPSQATKALRESRGIALLYFRPLH